MMRIIVYFCAALLFCVFSAFAESSYSQFERELQLTEPQKTRMEHIRNKYINEWQAVRKESTRKRIELKELDRSPATNIQRRNRLENELRDLDSARTSIYNQYKNEVSRMLNDKQRERYNSFFNSEDRKRRNYPKPERYDR